MQKKHAHAKGTVLLVYMALMTALNVILTRILAIDMGPYRISFGPCATVMAGLWLGPLCGGACGLMSDVLGCFLKGYPPNVLIAVASVLWGVFPGIAGRMLSSFRRKGRIAAISASIALSGLVGSIGFTTAGLVLILGYNFYAIFPGRVIQSVIMSVLYSVVCCVLYFSPLTGMVLASLNPKPVRI